MMKGVNFQFTATNKTGPAMSGVQNGLKGVTKATDAATRANQSMMRGMSDNRRAVQQVGFQVADFSVQVAGGQNAMLAFAQQGGQILQFFGAFGAVAGAALAVFAAFYMGMSKGEASVKSLKDAIGDVDNAMQAYVDATDMSLATMRELETQYGRNAAAARALFDAQVKIANMDMAKAQTGMVASLKAQVATVAQLADVLELPFQSAPMVQKSIANLTASIQAGMNLSKQEALNLNNALELLGTAKGPQQVFDASANIQTALLAAADASGKLPPELDAAYRSAVQLQQMALATGLEINNAADAGLRLNDTDMSGGLRNALSVAQQLALATREALFPAQGNRGDPRQFVDDKYWKNKYFPEPAKMNTPKASSGGGGDKSDPLAELREKLKLETELLGVSDAQKRIVNALGADWQKYGDVVINGLTAQIGAIEAFNQKMADQQSIADTIKSSMSDAFMGIVDGTLKAKDAFKSMASAIIRELFNVLVVQKLVGSFDAKSGTGSGIVGFLGGMMTKSFAGGGYTGAGARSGGLDGKGGFLATLHPNETVVDHTAGQGTGGVAVTQNISFGSGVTRAEVQTMIPKIVEATKAAVLDARKRGGSFGGAFS